MFRQGILAAMLTVIALLPTTATSEEWSNDGYTVRIIVDGEGGNIFLFPVDDLPIDQIHAATLDVYTLDPADPTLENLPAYMSAAAANGQDDCIRDLSGPILCWELGTVALDVSPVTVSSPDDLLWRGEGCVRINYYGGGSSTVRTHLDITPMVGNVLPGGTC